MRKIIASILHGAYGDYYEQAVCLKNLALKQPETSIKLFAASSHRLAELRVLDFSWAECFELYSEIPSHAIDECFQFQGHDRELRAEVFPKLPVAVREKIFSQKNRLPWQSLRSMLPLTAEQQIGLSDEGRRELVRVMRDNGIEPEIFQGPTIGFLWRYRAPGGAIRTSFQSDAGRLVAKYSRVFRRLVDDYRCHVLICGMNVQRTPENMYRIDAKYPEYGLDLPETSVTYLKGLSWALELEILSRCTVCIANPSGFSEALWIKRNCGVVLVDPPPDYLCKALWHRVPLFGLNRPSSLISAIASRREAATLAQIKSEFARATKRAGNCGIAKLQDIAS